MLPKTARYIESVTRLTRSLTVSNMMNPIDETTVINQGKITFMMDGTNNMCISIRLLTNLVMIMMMIPQRIGCLISVRAV